MLKNPLYHQGPPDLEDWFKKIFGKIMPRRRPTLKDLQPPEAQGFNTWWFILPFVFIVSLLLSGIITVKPGEQVVLTRLGVYQKTLLPGTHWVTPFIDRHVTVDTADVMAATASGLMRTQDQYLVNANVTLNYQVVDPKTYVFASQNLASTLQAFLQSASNKAIAQTSMASLLNKDNYGTLAKGIQADLNLDGAHYGLVIQNVAVNSIAVPDALSTQFMQTINQAQVQVKSMVQAAQDYKAALLPLAKTRAQAVQQAANLKKIAVVVQAYGNAAEFNALLPQYQKDPAATAAYLPLLLLPDVKNLPTRVAPSSSTPGLVNASGAQNAYNRWQSANQSEINAEQSQDQ